MVLGSLLGLWVFVLFGVAIAVCLNRVLAPEGKFLSFVPPKERNQRKGGIRVSFLLGPFLWTSKEKDLGCRSENRHKKHIAIAIPNC
jgi:hypothetical protein